MYTVDDIMCDSLFLIAGHASARQAALEMTKRNIGMLMILNDGKIAGMITERDLTRRILAQGQPTDTTSVGEIMQGEIVCIRSGASIAEACAMMLAEKVRYLPVVNENAEPIGIVGMTDLITFFGNSAELGALFDDD